MQGKTTSPAYQGGNLGAKACPTPSETTIIKIAVIMNSSLRERPWNENGRLNMDQPTFTKK